MSIKKGAAVAVKIAVSAALIAYLAGTLDLGAALARLSAAEPLYVLAAAGLILGHNLIGAWRWRIVLHALQPPAPISYLQAALYFYIGTFFNQALPSTAGGDVVRIYKTRRAGVRLITTINSVMLERAATVLALIVMVITVLPAFLPRITGGEASWIAPAALAPVLALLLGGAVGGLVFLMVLDRLPEAWARFRIVRGLARLAADTRTVFLKPRPALGALATAALGHLNLCVCVWLLAQSIGLDVTLLDCVALFLPVLLVITLPISIAGWGVREGAMVAAFGLIGAPEAGAFALSVLFGLVNVAVALPAGIAFLMSGDGRSLAEIEHDVEDAEAGGAPEKDAPGGV
ncbi:MAG: lysylphosphatidylglycerol synthase transmembrane domain-containing protein [Rhodospirillales bacterium]